MSLIVYLFLTVALLVNLTLPFMGNMRSFADQGAPLPPVTSIPDPCDKAVDLSKLKVGDIVIVCDPGQPNSGWVRLIEGDPLVIRYIFPPFFIVQRVGTSYVEYSHATNMSRGVKLLRAPAGYIEALTPLKK